MMMQACLGIRVDGWNEEIRVDRPRLPIGIDNLLVRNLAVGDRKVDLIFERAGERIACYLDRRDEGSVPLVVSS